MELADAVPFRRVAAEIGLRRRCAGGAHGSEPLAVACDGGVERVEPADELACERRAAAALAQAE